MIANIQKLKILIMVIITTIFSEISASSLFLPSIFIGSNINKMYCTESSRESDFTDYSYPFGYLIGIENKTTIIKRFYISNQIYLKRNKNKMVINPYADIVWPYLEFNSNYIGVSSNFGVNIYKRIDIIVGIDMSRLINYKMRSSEIYSRPLKVKKIKKYNYSCCFGLKENFKIKNENFYIELKYLLGITKNKFRVYYGDLPQPSKNNELQLAIGYKF